MAHGTIKCSPSNEFQNSKTKTWCFLAPTLHQRVSSSSLEKKASLDFENVVRRLTDASQSVQATGQHEWAQYGTVGIAKHQKAKRKIGISSTDPSTFPTVEKHWHNLTIHWTGKKSNECSTGALELLYVICLGGQIAMNKLFQLQNSFTTELLISFEIPPAQHRKSAKNNLQKRISFWCPPDFLAKLDSAKGIALFGGALHIDTVDKCRRRYARSIWKKKPQKWLVFMWIHVSLFHCDPQLITLDESSCLLNLLLIVGVLGLNCWLEPSVT